MIMPRGLPRAPYLQDFPSGLWDSNTTFCMANASDVRARSRPFAQIARFQGLRPTERTRANPSERRTLPFLPRLVGDDTHSVWGAIADRAHWWRCCDRRA
jgi:hypothetical protein